MTNVNTSVPSANSETAKLTRGTLPMITVEGIQDWGQSPSWSIETEYPSIVAWQNKYNDNLYDIEKLTYDEYGNIVHTELIGTCERNLITLDFKHFRDWGDEAYSDIHRA